MIIPDKKKMATAIVAQMHSSDEPADDTGDSFEALASEIISAVNSGSASGLASALRAFHAECVSGDYGNEE